MANPTHGHPYHWPSLHMVIPIIGHPYTWLSSSLVKPASLSFQYKVQTIDGALPAKLASKTTVSALLISSDNNDYVYDCFNIESSFSFSTHELLNILHFTWYIGTYTSVHYQNSQIVI